MDEINILEHTSAGGLPAKRVVDGNAESLLMLLRDIRKLLKTSAYGDAAQRQIVKIGAVGGISGGAEVTTTIPVSGTVTATVANIPAVGGFDARFQLYDMARVKYATVMRANLLFS